MNEENTEDLQLTQGTVKWFNNAKGYGFIETEDGQDVFVHFSVIDDEGYRTLKDGESVQYLAKEGPKGLHAVKVIRHTKKRSKLKPEVVVYEDSSSTDTAVDVSEQKPEQKENDRIQTSS